MRVKTVHKQTNIDEMSFETDVGNIAYPDLITSGDCQGFQGDCPKDAHLSNGVRGLTDAFDGLPRGPRGLSERSEQHVYTRRCIRDAPATA